jgi:succinate dehydrogenase / fumarate reductase membrane anchor subunit
MSLRSPLGRVLGTGSSRDGTGQWWAERVTSVALIPLTMWFFFSLLRLPALEYGPVHAWLALPVNGFLAILLVAVMTYHSFLGTTVIVEDYVRGNALRVFSLLVLRFLYVVVGGASVFALLRIALGS